MLKTGEEMESAAIGDTGTTRQHGTAIDDYVCDSSTKDRAGIPNCPAAAIVVAAFIILASGRQRGGGGVGIE